MTVSLPCMLCDQVIIGEDEDELVARVQAHADREHDLGHPLSRERILGHLAAQDPSKTDVGRRDGGPRRR